MPPPPAAPTIALIAHDAAKAALLEWAERHRSLLARCRVIATGTTASRLRERFPELDVEAVLSGPRGGDLQIGGRIAEGTIAAVVFLTDPLAAQPHEPDVRALIRVATLVNVPVAVNVATADILGAALTAQAHRAAAP